MEIGRLGGLDGWESESGRSECGCRRRWLDGCGGGRLGRGMGMPCDGGRVEGLQVACAAGRVVGPGRPDARRGSGTAIGGVPPAPGAPYPQTALCMIAA